MPQAYSSDMSADYGRAYRIETRPEQVGYPPVTPAIDPGQETVR